MAMFICYFVIMHQKIDLIKASVEDEITSSVLGGSLVDRKKYSLSGDIYIENNRESLKNFEEIFSYMEDLNGFEADGSTAGKITHPYFDFEKPDNQVIIKKYIVYNVPLEPNTEGHYIGEQYIYEDGAWKKENKECNYGSGFGTPTENAVVRTPLGAEIKQTAVYVEIEMPLKIGFFNIRNTVTKKQTVYIESI
jgi:hypothetical protein